MPFSVVPSIPPTVAHTALAAAARAAGRQVLWILPEQFPHKRYEGVALDDRLKMLLALGSDPVAVVQNGLYFDMAAEVSAALPQATVEILLGEDAARRIVEWDYGMSKEATMGYLTKNLERFPLLTAARERTWQAPAHIDPFLTWLRLDDAFQAVSSTQVRTLIETGAEWEHLVPHSIRSQVDALYGSTGNSRGQ